MEILEKLTKAVNYAFRADGTGPGITVAWLRHNQSYYVSIIRWISGEKIVEKSASNEKLEVALKELGYKFLEDVPPPANPIDELADFLVKPKIVQVAGNGAPFTIPLPNNIYFADSLEDAHALAFGS